MGIKETKKPPESAGNGGLRGFLMQAGSVRIGHELRDILQAEGQDGAQLVERFGLHAVVCPEPADGLASVKDFSQNGLQGLA